ncbi:MAG: tRNA (adenosine(37)-N6)-threonylcarbamoyltransferase complex ATPase subunit type 1 TsaE [Thermomicrobiales bacterium]
MTAESVEIEIDSPEAMRRFGEKIGRQILPGDIVLLHGDLGAGKTTLTQGILRVLGVTTAVNSPTFVLISEYSGQVANGEPVEIRHIDLYRLSDQSELESIGFLDIIDDPQGITIVEWPERAGDCLPPAYILVTFRFAGPDSRKLEIRIEPPGDRLLALVS